MIGMTETPRDQAASDRPDAGGADRAATARLDAAVQRSRRLSLGDAGGDDLDALQKVYGEEPAVAPRRPVSARRPATQASAGSSAPAAAPAAAAAASPAPAAAAVSAASGASAATPAVSEPNGDSAAESTGLEASSSKPSTAPAGAAAAGGAERPPLAETQLLSDAAERARERMGLSAPRRDARAAADAGATTATDAAAPARERDGGWRAPAAESAAAAAEGGDESPASADADAGADAAPDAEEKAAPAGAAAAAPERRTVVVDRTTTPARATGASSPRRAADEAVDRAFAPLGLSETKADSLPDLPASRGNRVFAVSAAVLATALFGAAYAAAFAGLRVVFTSGAEFVESLRAFATTAPFWLPTAVFGILFIVWALVGRRAGTWSYVFGGLLAAIAAFGSYHLGVVAQGAINGDGWSLGALQDSLAEPTNLPGALTAAIVAREAFTWVGLVVAARGRRLARLDARDRAAYDAAVADAQGRDDVAPTVGASAATDAGRRA